MTEYQANALVPEKLAAFCEKCRMKECLSQGCDAYHEYVKSLKIDGVEVKDPRKCAATILRYKGRDYILRELAEIYRVRYDLLQDRLRAGWSVERAVETPYQAHQNRRGIARKCKRVEFRGQMMTINEISQITGIKRSTIEDRYRNGKPLDAPLKKQFGRKEDTP